MVDSLDIIIECKGKRCYELSWTFDFEFTNNFIFFALLLFTLKLFLRVKRPFLYQMLLSQSPCTIGFQWNKTSHKHYHLQDIQNTIQNMMETQTWRYIIQNSENTDTFIERC